MYHVVYIRACLSTKALIAMIADRLAMQIFAGHIESDKDGTVQAQFYLAA
jgi:hypothetical protein